MANEDRMLDLDSRRLIFRHVEAHPGLHLRGIHRALEMPLGTVEYHLHQMEKSGLIVSREDGRFKAFFVSEGLDRRDKDILYYVRQEMPRQIIIRLLMTPESTHSELVAELPVSASTCSFHLKKLVKSGLVTERRVGRSKHFVVADAERVANVLVTYRKSFLDDLVDRFARAWLDVGRTETAAGGGDAAGGTQPHEQSATNDDDTQTEARSSKSGAAPGPLELARRMLAGGLYWFGTLALRATA